MKNHLTVENSVLIRFLHYQLQKTIQQAIHLNGKKLKKEKELKTGKTIKPVLLRNGKKIPSKCKCGHCNAPKEFLYLNNGKLQSQVKCKICGKTSSTNRTKRKPKAKYLCPYCSNALFKWKESRLGLSSRATRDAIKGIFDISLSHQTIINYINSTAGYLFTFIDKNCPNPMTTSAADETYIIVDNKWTYTWFIVGSKTRAICGYNLSQHRDMQLSLALLYNSFGKPDETVKHPDLVTDGNPSYDAAVMAYNDLIKVDDNKLTKRTVVGLQNLDKESSEYRSFKQLVERVNRTYKYHTRPRVGFKTFDGAAAALATLFVAFYNFMRPHSARENTTLVSLDSLASCSLMPEKWVTLIEQAAA